MPEIEPNEVPFKLVGGWLCLDFVNTVNWDSPEGSHERFHAYTDLVRWNRYVGALTDAEARPLLERAARQPQLALAVFEKIMRLRAVVHRIFAAIAAGLPPPDSGLATINAVLAETLAHSRLSSTTEGFSWAWAGAADDLERVFWPVAWSVAELLTSDRLNRVRRCAGESCGWLFLDTSRNHSRRWCEMQHCGNRAKAKRHYRRQRQVGASKT